MGMSTNEPLKAPCPKCRDEMIYITALPHPKAHYMKRATFVCRTCNRTWTYTLSTEMAEVYAVSHVIVEATV
jgi:transposase-like protein